MALKPTIYKFKIAISDFDHNYYDTLNLTVAQHPSENLERMLARIMAFCIHKAGDQQNLLQFTKGLSSVEEPDIWQKTLDDQLQLWIDVGEPSYDRIKKACRLAQKTCVYSFNSKSDVWWQQSQAQFSNLPVSIYQFDWESIKTLSANITRTMDLSITISDQTIYLAMAEEQLELSWRELQKSL